MPPVFMLIFNSKEILFWLKFWNTCLILLFSPRFQRKCNFFLTWLEFRWKSNGYVGGNLKRLAVYVYFFTLEFSTGMVNVIKEKIYFSLERSWICLKNFNYRVNWWILKGESSHWQANILYLKTHAPVMITWNLKYCVWIFQLNCWIYNFVTILAAFHFRHVIVS